MTSDEIISKFVIRRLDENDTIKSFDCGDTDLNDFIHNDAAKYLEEKLAVTYILQYRVSDRVGAYFSLANDRISNSEFPSNA